MTDSGVTESRAAEDAPSLTIPTVDVPAGAQIFVPSGARQTKAQIKASGALAALASGSVGNQNAIAEAGGIIPIVGLLDSRSNNKEVQAHAADALAELTRDHSAIQNTVAKAGAIEPLIKMLQAEGNSNEDLRTKEASAGALWSLSSLNFQIQTAVANAGGISPLVGLLGTGSNTAQKQAAGALCSLALDNEENEKAISTMVIELLVSSTKETALSGSAEKAARAISSSLELTRQIKLPSLGLEVLKSSSPWSTTDASRRPCVTTGKLWKILMRMEI